MGVNYPVLLGTDKVSEQYGNVEFLPTSFYIDRDGKIVGKGTGLLARSEIEENVRKALASPVAGISNARTSAATPTNAAHRAMIRAVASYYLLVCFSVRLRSHRSPGTKVPSVTMAPVGKVQVKAWWLSHVWNWTFASGANSTSIPTSRSLNC